MGTISHALRQRLLHLAQPGLHAIDDAQRVLAEAHDDDAADDFALAVELRRRRAAGPGRCATRATSPTRTGVPRSLALDGDLLDVVHRLQVAAAAHHVLAAGELEQPPLDVVVARLDRVDHVARRDLVRREPYRIEVDLVLLHEPADAGHFRHARHAREPAPQVPVLEAAQVGERVPPGVVDERVLEDPADAGRVGSDRRVDALGQLAADALQVLDDAAARPVDVGAVLEDDVDVRDAEIGEAADRLHVRRRDERRDDRIGDLVLDQIGTAARPLGRDDHLHVRDVRHRVERRVQHRPDAPDGQRQRPDEHQHAVMRAPDDESFNHGFCP